MDATLCTRRLLALAAANRSGYSQASSIFLKAYVAARGLAVAGITSWLLSLRGVAVAAKRSQVDEELTDGSPEIRDNTTMAAAACGAA